MAGGELRVRDIMTTKVHVVGLDDSIEDVHRMMQLGGIRHAPVVDGGRLVAVVTDHDIFLGWSRGIDTPIRDVMTKAPRWIRPEATAREAAGVVLRYKIGCLPVVDKELRVVGIVTETDFVELAQRALTIQEALSGTLS
jgi:CBS domain-containing protein